MHSPLIHTGNSLFIRHGTPIISLVKKEKSPQRLGTRSPYLALWRLAFREPNSSFTKGIRTGGPTSQKVFFEDCRLRVFSWMRPVTS
jgi:hypothetical protein